jgi:hypothetical protein
MEGSGAGSVQTNYVSGSRRPKNIRMIKRLFTGSVVILMIDMNNDIIHSLFAVLRTRDVYPRYEFFHPGSRIRIRILNKEFKYFTPNFFYKAFGNLIRHVYPRIWILSHPGSKGQYSTGSRIWIGNTAH